MPNGYSNLGAGLGAIQDAINMYFGLRQQKLTNQRQLGADQRAQEALGMQREGLNLDQAQFKETQLTNKRKMLGDLAETYPGARIPRQEGDTFREAGMGAAVSPDMTLPSRQTTGMATGLGQDTSLSPMSVPSPAADTGQDVINPTQSEKYRIAYLNAVSRANEGNLNRASAMARTEMTVKQRESDSRLRKQIADAGNDIRLRALTLQRYGIDLRQELGQRQLAALIANRSSNLLEDQWETQMRAGGGLGGLLMLMDQDGGGMPAPPTFPSAPPAYFTPPTANPGLVPGAGVGGMSPDAAAPASQSRFRRIQ